MPALMQALFAASPDALLVVDGEGRIVLANPTAAALLDYPIEHLVGLSIEALVPDSIRPRHAAFRRAYDKAPRPRPMGTQMDLVAKRRDGSEVMVEIALSPLQPQGLPYVMASIRGIGDYPRVREALQRARYSEHLAQLGKLAVDARDPQEVLQQVPLIAARALEADMAVVFLLEPGRTALRVASGVGLLEAEAVGCLVPNHPDTPAGFVLAQARPVIVEDYAREDRFTVPDPYRDAGLVSALAVPLSDRGRVVGSLAVRSRQAQRFGEAELRFLESVANLLGTCLQRQLTEEALNHSQRLETVGQLTGGIAHDFNNLLTVIQGNLQVLADLPSVSGDGFAPQLVAAATRASRRGAELTGKLLAFSRRQMLQPASVDVAALLQSLGDMLRRTLDQRIRIRINVAAGCPDVLADPGQLESALLNIAINARDAMPEGGALSFEAAELPASGMTLQLRRSLEEDGDKVVKGARYVRLTISDTGAGMSEAVKERAFEPFFTTKQAGRGTGLGLSTVYGFARQSRGAIHIDSTPGVGTALTLVLPQPPRAHEPATDAEIHAGVLPPALRVMLVEDDAEVRAVARRFLSDLGCRVTACVSGEEAMRRLLECGGDAALLPQLLLTDIALGAGMRGTELAALVRQSWPGLAVLLMSGFSVELLASEPEASIGWELLPKPYTRDQLATAMGKVLSVGR